MNLIPESDSRVKERPLSQDRMVLSQESEPWERESHLDSRNIARFYTKIRDRIKGPDHLIGFSVKKRNGVLKKGLFFIHFHRNDPQYHRRYPGQRLLIFHFILDG